MMHRRTPITVTSYIELTARPFVTLLVSGFRGPEIVTPIAVLPEAYRAHPEAAVGLTFMGMADISALTPDDVQIRELEPEPCRTTWPSEDETQPEDGQ